MNLAKKDLGMQRNIDNISVAVYMITYNHQKIISKAIDSVLMQGTNFNYKLIIGEDFSTDNTRDICLKYMDLYPEKIELLLNDHNIGASLNAERTYKKCIESGAKYIAMLEGDDYWTDEYKLQKQFDFLEKNNDFSICFTDYLVFDETNKKFNYPDLKNKYKIKSVFSTNKIILTNFIPTASVMFKARKEVFSKLDPNLYPGDWFLHILNSEYGKIKFLPFETTVYRKHDGGVCSATSPIINNQKYLKSIKIFRKVYSKNYKVQFLYNIVVIKIRLQNIKFKLLVK
jgi:glycosyltransferase involved in cell wall biosynthesis